MVAQGCPTLKPNTLESSTSIGFEEFSQLQLLITKAAEEGVAAHVVERDLFRKVLELGYVLFAAFLKITGAGNMGETVQLEDGRVVTRLSELHCRRLLTVFGEFQVERYVYGTDEKQRIEFVPVDTRLQLPESDVSYLLQQWDQLLGIESAFNRTRDVIEQILRLKQSVDTLDPSFA